jgi:hypothetical protein
MSSRVTSGIGVNWCDDRTITFACGERGPSFTRGPSEVVVGRNDRLRVTTARAWCLGDQGFVPWLRLPRILCPRWRLLPLSSLITTASLWIIWQRPCES